MKRVKKYRWVCPSCGEGKLASSRPAKDATVRFCLDCSSGSPTLVERTCPSLDKRRSEKVERARVRSARKRETARAKKRSAREQSAREALAQAWVGTDQDVRKYDIWAEASRLVRLLRAEGYEFEMPKVILRTNRQDRATTGTSYGGRVVLTYPRSCAAHRALALLCHEMAHEACPDEGHSESWRAAFLRCVELGYGARVEGQHPNKFALHTAVELALREALSRGVADVVS